MIGPGAFRCGVYDGKFRDVGAGGKSALGAAPQDHHLDFVIGANLAK